METVIDLKDLLKHEIMDLYSVEEQIIEALPLMIEKAGNAKLKEALKDHLKVTKEQRARLDEIKQMLGQAPAGGDAGDSQKPGFFSRLFGGGEKCKGMEGIITEGKKMMSADMSPEASDAAIIASAQKIEHYEISGYGTARAFARELNLGEVAYKLEQTLNEEYQADDLLTQLAVGKVNVVAEFAGGSANGSKSKLSQANSNGSSNGSSAGTKNKRNCNTAKSNEKTLSRKASSVKSSPSKSSSKSSASKSNSSSVKKSSSNGRNNNTAGKLKAAGKKSVVKSSKGRINKSSSKSRSSRAR